MAMLTLIALQINNSNKGENNFFDQRHERLDDVRMWGCGDVQM